MFRRLCWNGLDGTWPYRRQRVVAARPAAGPVPDAAGGTAGAGGLTGPQGASLTGPDDVAAGYAAVPACDEQAAGHDVAPTGGPTTGPISADSVTHAIAPIGRSLSTERGNTSRPDPGDGQAELWACYEAEFSWLQQAVGARVACLLAARTAASCQHVRTPHGPAARPHPFGALLSARPPPASLPACLHAAGVADWARPLDRPELASLARLWPLAECTEAMLAAGGDERLALDPATRLNRYHCAPWPRPDVVSFGSCTASSLSAPAFAAAGLARRRLAAAAASAGTEAALAQASRATEAAILSHYQVVDLAGAVLTASGTDAALVVTALLAAEHPHETMTSILVSAAETGSGVPDAVQARHFAGLAPGATPVDKGARLAGFARTPRLTALALRDAAGRAFTAAEMEAACTSAVTAALATGRATLHAIDGSKTGLTAPDKPGLLRLRARFGAALDIVVDACQARIEPADLRWYLQHGFPVMVTGSKFFTAPGFCGALLFPRARLEAVAAARLPAGLAAYARLDGGFGSRRCAGLLLRWAAALHEMTAFAGCDPGEVTQRLDGCAGALRQAVARDGRLALVAAPRPPGAGWSGRQSVFTFTVRDGQGLLGADRLRALYVAGAASRCQLGQPVLLGDAGVAGLRIALSAAQLRDDSAQEQVEDVVARVGELLDAG